MDHLVVRSTGICISTSPIRSPEAKKRVRGGGGGTRLLSQTASAALRSSTLPMITRRLSRDALDVEDTERGRSVNRVGRNGVVDRLRSSLAREVSLLLFVLELKYPISSSNLCQLFRQSRISVVDLEATRKQAEDRALIAHRAGIEKAKKEKEVRVLRARLCIPFLFFVHSQLFVTGRGYETAGGHRQTVRRI